MQPTHPLQPPRSKITKVLYMLILRPEIKETDFRLTSFRSIISDLKNDYAIPIRHKDKKDVDEFGKQVVYRVRYLWEISRAKAVRAYLKMNSA